MSRSCLRSLALALAVVGLALSVAPTHAEEPASAPEPATAKSPSTDALRVVIDPETGVPVAVHPGQTDQGLHLTPEMSRLLLADVHDIEVTVVNGVKRAHIGTRMLSPLVVSIAPAAEGAEAGAVTLEHLHLSRELTALDPVTEEAADEAP